jgi:hypothetical protein
VNKTPQYSKTDPRFRTKNQIATDISFILAAPIFEGTKFAVLKDAMWTWTELDGKYSGCKFWTPLAFAKQHVNRIAKRNAWSGLRHEHIVPKRVVIDMLRALKDPTPEAVFEICENFLIAVVVTTEEDAILNEFRSLMPPDFYNPASPSYRDPWLRYKHSKISWGTESRFLDAANRHCRE